MEEIKKKIELYQKLYEIMDEVSDEVGEEKIVLKEEEFVIKYEGWSGNCVPIEELEKKLGRKVKENDMLQYCKMKSLDVIEEEWKPQMEERGLKLMEMGFEGGGLIGKAWAIFRK